MSGPPSACLLLLGLSLPPGLPLDTSQGRTAALHDQQSSEWNSPRTRRLIERAIGRRALWAGDDSLRDYRAHAEAHVYFLFDVGRDTERQLVKADQLAIDIFWRAPGETRQVFIGHREEKTLPTDITYHIDHLMVVMDNFADSISLGVCPVVSRSIVRPRRRRRFSTIRHTTRCSPSSFTLAGSITLL